MHRLFTTLAFASLMICLGGCDSEKPTKSDPPPEPEFAVAGQIYLFNCYGRGDVFNNPPGQDYRCAVRADYPARVTFVDTASGMSFTASCDSNGYSTRLDSGIYNAIVESSCSFPDTVFGLSVASDDTLDFDLTAGWIPGGYLRASIGYHPKTDSLGGERERELLDSLVSLIADGILDASHAQWDGDYESYTSRWVFYTIPVFDTMEAWKAVQQAFSTDATQDSVFAPHTCQLYPPVMICLAATRDLDQLHLSSQNLK